MIAAVGPEEFGEFRDLWQHTGIDSLGMRQYFLEETLLLQSIGGKLIVNNRIDGDGSLRQPVGESLLTRREGLKAGRVQLDERRIANALDDDAIAFVLLTRRRQNEGEDDEQEQV